MWFSDGTAAGIGSGITPNVGEWYHLTTIVDEINNEFKFYVNGEQVSSTYSITKPLREYNVADWNMMGYLNSKFVANGKVDECQIFNKALSDKEVKALYGLDLS